MMLRTCLVATLVFCGAACALAQSSRPPERQQEDASAKRQQDTVEQLRAIAAELTAIRAKQADTEQRAATYEAGQRDQVYWPPVWSNWVLALFAGAAALIAAGTLGAINKQVTANVDEAKATADSVAAMKIIERAQIGVPHDSWKSEYKPSGPDPRYYLKISFSVMNAGKTLGYFKLTVFHTREGVGPDDGVMPMQFFQNDAALEMDAAILPGQSIPQAFHPFLLASDQEINAIMNGGQTHWTFGRISYRDIFGNVHYTNFTARFLFPSRTFSFRLDKGFADGN